MNDPKDLPSGGFINYTKMPDDDLMAVDFTKMNDDIQLALDNLNKAMKMTARVSIKAADVIALVRDRDTSTYEMSQKLSWPPKGQMVEGHDESFKTASFLAGTLIGVRSFRVTPSAQIASPTFQRAVWGPGINEAQCLLNARYYEDIPEHLPGLAECICGFYGYHQGLLEQEHMQERYSHFGTMWKDPFIGGIIEASGRVTVGDLGFRCGKARILCLFPLPYREDSFHPEWLSSCVPLWAREIFTYVDSMDEALERYPLSVRPVSPKTPE